MRNSIYITAFTLITGSALAQNIGGDNKPAPSTPAKVAPATPTTQPPATSTAFNGCIELMAVAAGYF